MIKQCKWECPICFEGCGGVIFHSGEHQCPIHYKAFKCKKCGIRTSINDLSNKTYISLEKLGLCRRCVE